MLAVDAGDPTLLGIAAILSALGGVISTVWSHRKATKDEREKQEEICRQKLREARKEAEEAAEELHRIKMEGLKELE
jgi:hypothetical protein